MAYMFVPTDALRSVDIVATCTKNGDGKAARKPLDEEQ